MFNKIRYFFSNTTSQFLIKKFYKQIQVTSEPNPLYPYQNFCIKLDNKHIKSPNSHIIKGSSRKSVFFCKNSLKLSPFLSIGSFNCP